MNSKTIEIKTPGIQPLTFFLIVWTLFLWVMVVVLLFGMIGRPSEIESLWFLWLVMIGIGTLTSNHIIWEMVGKVRVKINSDSIHLINVNNLFKNEVYIPIHDFNRIVYSEDPTNMPGRFWGFTKGNIVLHHKNGHRRFGKDLSKRDSLLYINRIESAIEHYA